MSNIDKTKEGCWFLPSKRLISSGGSKFKSCLGRVTKITSNDTRSFRIFFSDGSQENYSAVSKGYIDQEQGTPLEWLVQNKISRYAYETAKTEYPDEV